MKMKKTNFHSAIKNEINWIKQNTYSSNIKLYLSYNKKKSEEERMEHKLIIKRQNVQNK